MLTTHFLTIFIIFIILIFEFIISNYSLILELVINFLLIFDLFPKFLVNFFPKLNFILTNFLIIYLNFHISKYFVTAKFWLIQQQLHYCWNLQINFSFLFLNYLLFFLLLSFIIQVPLMFFSIVEFIFTNHEHFLINLHFNHVEILFIFHFSIIPSINFLTNKQLHYILIAIIIGFMIYY